MMNAMRFYRAARWLYLRHIPVLPQIIKGIFPIQLKSVNILSSLMEEWDAWFIHKVKLESGL